MNDKSKMKNNIQELRRELIILSTLKIKPNYSALSRKYNVDRRTIKKYDLGYDGTRVSASRTSKLDKYKKDINSRIIAHLNDLQIKKGKKVQVSKRQKNVWFLLINALYKR